jgi:hypothetical protein
VITTQPLSAVFAATIGNFAKESGLEENCVRSTVATFRRMMDPWNGYGFGKENRQSPQISRALWYQASNLSDTGTKSVENDSDIGLHREFKLEGGCTDQPQTN